MKPITKTLLWVTLFAIAMGFLETSIVVYLRELLYPNGFHFPLAPMKPSIYVTELFRELATMIMLVGIGYLAGRSLASRFAWFLYSFAIWDILYYVFLKVILDWPSSLEEWDILFLIPFPWVGPVWAPVLVSICMIMLSWIILYFESKAVYVKISPKEWILFITGSLVIIYSFVYDYLFLLLSHQKGTDLFTHLDAYTPAEFQLTWFFLGMLFVVGALISLALRYKNSGQDGFETSNQSALYES